MRQADYNITGQRDGFLLNHAQAAQPLHHAQICAAVRTTLG